MSAAISKSNKQLKQNVYNFIQNVTQISKWKFKKKKYMGVNLFFLLCFVFQLQWAVLCATNGVAHDSSKTVFLGGSF